MKTVNGMESCNVLMTILMTIKNETQPIDEHNCWNEVFELVDAMDQEYKQLKSALEIQIQYGDRYEVLQNAYNKSLKVIQDLLSALNTSTKRGKPAKHSSNVISAMSFAHDLLCSHERGEDLN